MSEKSETLDLNRVIDEFEEVTRNAEEVQKQILEDILQKNKSTVYLQKKCGLNGSTNVEDFKAKVPLVTHQDLEPYIEKMMNGDKSHILTVEPVNAFSLSSGTTQGRSKYIPYTEVFMENTMQLYQTAFAYRNKEFPTDNGKVLPFVYAGKPSLTESGPPVRTSTGNICRNPKFKDLMRSIQSNYCCPDEVLFSPDVHQALYCHLLCGVLCRDEIQYVRALFASSVVQAFRTFENVWEDIVTDIRDGVLSSRVTVPSVREAVSKILRPDPELSDLIRTKFLSLKNWYGVIPALFPNVKYVYAIMTGSMEPYVNKLRHYAADLPLVSYDYASSESYIAMNVTPRSPPEEVTFAVIPNFAYLEFAPMAETDEEQPKPVGLSKVKVGEEYEVILTTYSGLYRYMLGDVVKIMGFYNKTPQIKFMRRKSLILSIDIDKSTERDLQVSVEAAAKRLAEEDLEVVDFSSYADLTTEPGHYVIFWEVSGETRADVLQECCNILDKSFVGVGYVISRNSKNIGALELRVVARGTVGKVQEHFMGLGASASQFKMPRCVSLKNTKVLEILCDSVVSKFFSKAYDGELVGEFNLLNNCDRSRVHLISHGPSAWLLF